MATQIQKRIKKVLINSEGEDSKITYHKDGTVSIRRSYFYTHGMNEDKFAEHICSMLSISGFNVTVEGSNHYHNWPKESYWLARISS